MTHNQQETPSSVTEEQSYQFALNRHNTGEQIRNEALDRWVVLSNQAHPDHQQVKAEVNALIQSSENSPTIERIDISDYYQMQDISYSWLSGDKLVVERITVFSTLDEKGNPSYFMHNGKVFSVNSDALKGSIPLNQYPSDRRIIVKKISPSGSIDGSLILNILQDPTQELQAEAKQLILEQPTRIEGIKAA